jgi:hypothetical protein
MLFSPSSSSYFPTYFHAEECVQISLQGFGELDVPKLRLLLRHPPEPLVRGQDFVLDSLIAHELNRQVVLEF